MAETLTLKDINIKLPKGIFLNKEGFRALSSQVNTVINNFEEDYIKKDVIPTLKINLDKSFSMFFGEMQKSNGMMYKDITGNLTSLTGYAIAYNDVIVYKKNGRFAAFKSKPRPNADPIQNNNASFISQQFASLPKDFKMVMFKSKDINTVSVYLFSSAKYSSWVNYSLGTQRTDGRSKRGQGWFTEYSDFMYNSYNSTITDKFLNISHSFKGRSGGFRLNKK